MKVLVTGANGYIGRRLLPQLVRQGHQVVALVRDPQRIELEDHLEQAIELYTGDLTEPESLAHLARDIDVCYYLVHSMGSSKGSFQDLEAQAARNIVEHFRDSQLQQIIYLAGIANDTGLSKHLESRRQVEQILGTSQAALTVLRAAIIIGSGGASFEIIRDLVEKLPVMVAPRWLKTRCQPIAVRNVLEYLSAVALNRATFDRVFDIGGPDILTYREMLLGFARMRGLRRWIIQVPVLSPRLSSRWLYFVTSTSYPLARSLVESMRNEVVVKQGNIQEVVPLRLYSYEEALERAFQRIAQNEVISSWKDALASSSIDPGLMEYVEVPTYGCFVDRRIRPIRAEKEHVLDNVWSIGGDKGWYYLNNLWRVRGWLDKLVGGVGLRRGRRSPDQLVPGDSLDFWRVLRADRQRGRLLLFAEMKLPGEAWLEFRVQKKKTGEFDLVQTATFRPRGLAGRLYWYSILPFHAFIFAGMINTIISQAKESQRQALRQEVASQQSE